MTMRKHFNALIPPGMALVVCCLPSVGGLYLYRAMRHIRPWHPGQYRRIGWEDQMLLTNEGWKEVGR